PIIGINGRLDTMQAAVVLAKMDLFEEEIALRQAVAAGYNERLAGASLQLPFVAEGNTSVYAQYTVLTPERDALQSKLGARGVPSVPYYSVPLHLQPAFSVLNHRKGDFPVTEQIASTGISLPMSPYVTDEDLNTVASAILSV
ncbi:MAG: DegT/DnrJ/EryC1/StrS family aminotransferase, partial [Verrucomicrobiales bacterium]